MSKKKVLIVDDHEIFRMGVVSLLAATPREFDVLEASTCKQAITAVSDQQIDLIILDQNLPDGSGLEVMGSLLELCDSAHVILLTGVLSGTLATQALAAGASAVLAKRGRGDDLLNAIDSLARQEPFIDKNFQALLSNLNELDLLTRREYQVLGLLLGGSSTREIAKSLAIGFKTAETHRTRIMGKLGVHSYRELLMKARELGLSDHSV